MARMLHKLTPKQVAAASEPGRVSDGGGLYLSISPDGRKRWVFMYALKGKQRELGLGSALKEGVTLAKAREAAGAARRLLQAGSDPIEVKRASKRATAPQVVPSFGTFADEYIKTMRPAWHNERHAAQWETTLKTHAAPIRGKLVNEIDTEGVLSVLQPIWSKIPETAQRLRGRIELILDAAKSKGHRDGENPARWRGHLAHLLPKRQKLTRGHHRSLPYEQIPEFMKALRAETCIMARLVEFAILTGARSNEVRGCSWDELDLAKSVWTVPPSRMKAKREHRVPLCNRALEIIEELARVREGNLVFPSPRGNKYSDMAAGQLLKRMGYGQQATLHGFRASFRTWASDTTAFPHDICEAALAHVIRDQTVAAYQRGDLLERRRKLMVAWENYCQRGDNVVHIAQAVS